MKKIIIFILILAAFLAGIFYKDDAVRFYNTILARINSSLKSLEKKNIGEIISEVQKQVSMPAPLKIGGEEKQVVLLKSKIISETNIQRQENGSLPALKENVKLNAAAAAKANDMFKNQYFEHVSPAGVDPGALVQNHGYDFIVAGENLILGNFSSEKDVVQSWMDSPGHRANILNNRYTEIGVAIIKGTYKGERVWIGVQEFGTPLSVCSKPNEVLKNSINSNTEQLDALYIQIEKKKQEINSSNPKSATYKQMVNDYNDLIEEYNLLAETTKRLVIEYNNQVSNFNLCVTGK